jgi:hypothetical protein
MPGRGIDVGQGPLRRSTVRSDTSQRQTIQPETARS